MQIHDVTHNVCSIILIHIISIKENGYFRKKYNNHHLMYITSVR